MVWIKRNLALVVSGLVGLVLIGFGTYLVLGGLARNKELSEEVERTRNRASVHYDANPFPSQTNIAMAKQEMETLRAGISRAQKHFSPVPLEKMDIKRFMAWRDETLNELRLAAKHAGTDLPSDRYPFSFATQRDRTQFGPNTLPHVAEQMAEVKALCMMLFDARVNRIGNIRRAKVSDDDKNSSFGSDYTTAGVLDVMNDPAGHMVSHPYEFTFYSFTTELAEVLNRLQRSTNGFLLKAIQVEPEDKTDAIASAPPVNLQNPERPVPPVRRSPPPPGATNRVAAPPPVARPTANDRPVTLLKEKRLKVTMLIYATRPVTKT
jgi:hypothetical protein